MPLAARKELREQLHTVAIRCSMPAFSGKSLHTRLSEKIFHRLNSIGYEGWKEYSLRSPGNQLAGKSGGRSIRATVS